MTDTLRNMSRYIRNTDAFGWQGADGPNGPWRSIAPPQSGAPWQTSSPMDDLRQASADVSGVELEPGWQLAAAGPTRDEAVALYSEVMAVHNCQTLGDMAEHFARAVLAKWGKQ